MVDLAARSFPCLPVTQNLFKVLAGLFELFVFCYIGSSLFLQTEKYNIFGYTVRPRHVLIGRLMPRVTLPLPVCNQQSPCLPCVHRRSARS